MITSRILIAGSIFFALACDGSISIQASAGSADGSLDSQVESSPSSGDGDSGDESVATGMPETGAPDQSVSEGGSAPDVEAATDTGAGADVEAGPSQPFSCPGPSSPWRGVDTTACNPFSNTGCAAGQTCALVDSSAVGCVPSNLAASDAGTGRQGWPCTAGPGCGDGTTCNQKQLCGVYCCTDVDCAATGLAGLRCVGLTYAGDAGLVADAGAWHQWGVCQ